MDRVFNNITSSLDSSGIPYHIDWHEPVYTATQAGDVAGHPFDEGSKCIVFQGRSRIYVVSLVTSERLHLRALKHFLDEKKLRMLPNERLKELFEMEAGAVAPFGYETHGIEVSLLVSACLLARENVYISPGKNDATLRISGSDFRQIMKERKAIILTGDCTENEIVASGGKDAKDVG